MPEWLDTSLYPDAVPPETLNTPGDRLDLLARVCNAWDLGVLPGEGYNHAGAWRGLARGGRSVPVVYLAGISSAPKVARPARRRRISDSGSATSRKIRI